MQLQHVFTYMNHTFVQQVTKSLIDYQIYFKSYFWFEIILSLLISILAWMNDNAHCCINHKINHTCETLLHGSGLYRNILFCTLFYKLHN